MRRRLRAVRENRKFVVQSDLEESIEVVIADTKRKPCSFDERETDRRIS